jgi:TRAP-type C4-dicarboxylate transport system permease large subunit
MNLSIPRLLYENSFAVFLFVTVFLGGGAAWLTGRAIASTWRPFWHALAYALVLTAVVRFIHYALFGGTFTSLHFYAVDAVVCLVFAGFAYRRTRARQMAVQYGWLAPPA